MSSRRTCRLARGRKLRTHELPHLVVVNGRGDAWGWIEVAEGWWEQGFGSPSPMVFATREGAEELAVRLASVHVLACVRVEEVNACARGSSVLALRCGIRLLRTREMAASTAPVLTLGEVARAVLGTCRNPIIRNFTQPERNAS